jgi:TrpR family trp operon transcriptional repressor
MKQLKEIANILSITDDQKIIEKFLICLLTPKEVDEISLRWELVKLLDEGMPQRKISEKLGVSLCKITRGSKELKKKGSAFKYIIDIHNSLTKTS